jgi:hypothetical protein
MKLDTDSFPIGMVELMDKKVLVRTDQERRLRVRTWSFSMNCTTE